MGRVIIPEIEAILEKVPDELKEKVQKYMKEISEEAFKKYQELNQAGIARELARALLPVNLYTRWYWKIDLHNLFHFLRLRIDPRAQYEIRVYAEVMAEITKKVAPLAYEAFEDYKLSSITLSKLEVEALDTVLEGENVDEVCENVGFRKGRELNEFKEKLEILLKKEKKLVS